MVIMPKVRNMRISFSRKIKAFHATRIGKKRMENKVFMAMYICGVGAFPDPKRSLVTPPDEEVVNRFLQIYQKPAAFARETDGSRGSRPPFLNYSVSTPSVSNRSRA